MARSEFFRANVGAVLCAPDGRVLAFERADVPGSWQLPQGGLDEGEEPGAAVLREVEEETGIPARGLDLLAAHPELLAYELPFAMRSKETGRGQVQYWFYLATDAEPALPDGGEFCAWRWMELDALASEVVAFRRGIYRRLADHYQRSVRPRT